MQTQHNPDGVSFAAVMGRIDAQMGKNTHALLQEYMPGAVDVHELSPSEARGFICLVKEYAQMFRGDLCLVEIGDIFEWKYCSNGADHDPNASGDLRKTSECLVYWPWDQGDYFAGDEAQGDGAPAADAPAPAPAHAPAAMPALAPRSPSETEVMSTHSTPFPRRCACQAYRPYRLAVGRRHNQGFSLMRLGLQPLRLGNVGPKHPVRDARWRTHDEPEGARAASLRRSQEDGGRHGERDQ